MTARSTSNSQTYRGLYLMVSILLYNSYMNNNTKMKPHMLWATTPGVIGLIVIFFHCFLSRSISFLTRTSHWEFIEIPIRTSFDLMILNFDLWVLPLPIIIVIYWFISGMFSGTKVTYDIELVNITLISLALGSPGIHTINTTVTYQADGKNIINTTLSG